MRVSTHQGPPSASGAQETATAESLNTPYLGGCEMRLRLTAAPPSCNLPALGYISFDRQGAALHACTAQTCDCAARFLLPCGCAGSVLAIAHGRSMARLTAPAVLGESALLAALAGVPARRPLTYRCCFWPPPLPAPAPVQARCAVLRHAGVSGAARLRRQRVTRLAAGRSSSVSCGRWQRRTHLCVRLASRFRRGLRGCGGPPLKQRSPAAAGRLRLAAWGRSWSVIRRARGACSL